MSLLFVVIRTLSARLLDEPPVRGVIGYLYKNLQIKLNKLNRRSSLRVNALIARPPRVLWVISINIVIVFMKQDLLKSLVDTASTIQCNER